MFRIPWKHAAKKDYRETADAALFKVRAVPFNPVSKPVLPKYSTESLHPYSVSDTGHLYISPYLLHERKTGVPPLVYKRLCKLNFT